MTISVERAKLLEEIDLIPEDRLDAIYHLLHYFRLGLEASREDSESVMRFAGCWGEMTDEAFDAFARDIAERRQRAFSRRPNRDAGTH
jgi:hypothetical protein